MDVYGYSPYHYGQSDELAKQMLAQQALAAAATPFPREIPEPHTMPVPPSSPWNSRGLSWGMPSPPQVVQFTAQTPFKEPKLGPVVHCKRKSLDVEPAIPAKLLITEEKMAAHLNSLHISSNYTSHSLANEEQMDIWMDTPSTSMLDTDKLKGHTIVLSEELKKITEEPIIPQTLMERLEKPSMSLVVWKPRENIIEKIIDKDDKTKENDEDYKKRNGVLVSEDIGMTEIADVEM